MALVEAVLPRELSTVLKKIRIRARLVQLLKRAVPWLCLGVVLLTAVKLALFSEWIEGTTGQWLQLVLLSAMGIVVLVALLPSLSRSRAAALLDASAGGTTVIPAAVSFHKAGESHLFAQLTMEQALSQLQQVDMRRALPISLPRELFYLPPLLVLYVVLPRFAPEPQYGMDQFTEVAPLVSLLEIRPDIAVEDPQFAVIKDEIKDLVRKTKLFGTKETRALVKDLQKLLSDMEKGKLTPFQAAKVADAIQKSLKDASDDPFLKERELAFRAVAKQLRKEKSYKDLAKALLKNNMTQVEKELLELEKRLSKLSQSKRSALEKRLNRAVERAARSLEKRAKKLLKAAKIAHNRGNHKKASQKTREAKRMKRAAETARKLTTSDSQKRRYLQKRVDQAKRRNLKRLARSLQRALKKLGREGANRQNKKGGERGERGQKGQRDRKALQGQKGQKGKTGRRNAMRNMRKALERYARRRRESQNSKSARMTAQGVKEAMRRLKSGRGGQCKNRSRGGIKDFFKRARGQGSRRSLRGSRGGKGRGSQGYKSPRGSSASRGGARSGDRGKGRNGKGRKGKGAGKGKGTGRGWGKGRGGKLYGRETRIAVKSKDRAISSRDESGGPSRFDVILGAAEKGFSKTSYKKVYTKYKDRSKEVIKEENIPPGYKHLIKVYYKLIRPRS